MEAYRGIARASTALLAAQHHFITALFAAFERSKHRAKRIWSNSGNEGGDQKAASISKAWQADGIRRK